MTEEEVFRQSPRRSWSDLAKTPQIGELILEKIELLLNQQQKIVEELEHLQTKVNLESKAQNQLQQSSPLKTLDEVPVNRNQNRISRSGEKFLKSFSRLKESPKETKSHEPEKHKLSEKLKEKKQAPTSSINFWGTLWTLFLTIVILCNIMLLPFRLAFLEEEEDFLFWIDFLTFSVYFLDHFLVHLATQIFQLESAYSYGQKFYNRLPSISGHVKIKKNENKKDTDTEKRTSSNLTRSATFSKFSSFSKMHSFSLGENETRQSFLSFLIPARISWRFFLGSLSSIPLPYLLRGYFEGGMATSRFLFLLQLWKSERLLISIGKFERRGNRFNPVVVRLIHLVLLSFMIVHWVGCIWFFIGRLEGYGCNEWVPSLELTHESLLRQYLKSLHWAFVNMHGMEISMPVSNLEYAISLVLVSVSVSMYATIVGNVGSLLSNLDSASRMYREKMDSVTTYMKYKEIPSHLQERVLSYYEYLWSRQKGLDEHEILRDLPTSMHTEISLFLNREVLEKVPFFKNASDNFINVLVRLLKPQVFAPGEFIIRYGDIGKEMYFINRGVVEVCAEDGNTVFNVLSDGSFFGEYALLFSQKRTASVRSVGYCDLFMLTREDFQSVLEDFPEFALAMRKVGIKRVFEKIPWFQTFTHEVMDELVTVLSPMTITQGSFIVCRGEYCKEMFFVCSGSAAVIDTDDRSVLQVLSDGGFFGEWSLLVERPSLESLRALSHCELLVLARSDFESVLQRNLKKCAIPKLPIAPLSSTEQRPSLELEQELQRNLLQNQHRQQERMKEAIRIAREEELHYWKQIQQEQKEEKREREN